MIISVKEAQKKILAAISPQAPITVSLEKSCGRVLAENIVSPYPLPFFDNAAMDGYAVSVGDNEYTVMGMVQAGDLPDDFPTKKLEKGEAMRIFTGAMIPQGADAVVKQEDVLIKNGKIEVRKSLRRGENIRYQGEEIKKEGRLFQVGERLTPSGIGLLASVGFHEVPIVSPPRVGILITGSEIVTDIHSGRSLGHSLGLGKIFDSNSFALTAALEELHVTPSFVQRVSDDPISLQRVILQGLSQSDFLIVTGGVSVGDFDFVKDVSKKVGVEEVFWKVKQKPGKPLFFGKYSPSPQPSPTRGEGDKFIFGLPGNPVSALVCFYEYVRPALLRSMGARDLFLLSLRAPLKESFRKKSGMTHFARGKTSPFPLLTKEGEGGVEILDHQGSHRMTSFARANCLVVLPEEQEIFETGEEVEIHLLPS